MKYDPTPPGTAASRSKPTSNARATTLLLTTIAAALLAAAALPSAEAAADVLKARVAYADLDLAHALGRATLKRRIDLAVAQVCGERPLTVELARLKAWSRCRDDAWNGARRQLALIYGDRSLAQTPGRKAPGL